MGNPISPHVNAAQAGASISANAPLKQELQQQPKTGGSASRAFQNSMGDASAPKDDALGNQPSAKAKGNQLVRQGNTAGQPARAAPNRTSPPGQQQISHTQAALNQLTDADVSDASQATTNPSNKNTGGGIKQLGRETARRHADTMRRQLTQAAQQSSPSSDDPVADFIRDKGYPPLDYGAMTPEDFFQTALGREISNDPEAMSAYREAFDAALQDLEKEFGEKAGMAAFFKEVRAQRAIIDSIEHTNGLMLSAVGVENEPHAPQQQTPQPAIPALQVQEDDLTSLQQLIARSQQHTQGGQNARMHQANMQENGSVQPYIVDDDATETEESHSIDSTPPLPLPDDGTDHIMEGTMTDLPANHHSESGSRVLSGQNNPNHMMNPTHRNQIDNLSPSFNQEVDEMGQSHAPPRQVQDNNQQDVQPDIDEELSPSLVDQQEFHPDTSSEHASDMDVLHNLQGNTPIGIPETNTYQHHDAKPMMPLRAGQDTTAAIDDRDSMLETRTFSSGRNGLANKMMAAQENNSKYAEQLPEPPEAKATALPKGQEIRGNDNQFTIRHTNDNECTLRYANGLSFRHSATEKATFLTKPNPDPSSKLDLKGMNSQPNVVVELFPNALIATYQRNNNDTLKDFTVDLTLSEQKNRMAVLTVDGWEVEVPDNGDLDLEAFSLSLFGIAQKRVKNFKSDNRDQLAKTIIDDVFKANGLHNDKAMKQLGQNAPDGRDIGVLTVLQEVHKPLESASAKTFSV